MEMTLTQVRNMKYIFIEIFPQTLNELISHLHLKLETGVEQSVYFYSFLFQCVTRVLGNTTQNTFVKNVTKVTTTMALKGRDFSRIWDASSALKDGRPSVEAPLIYLTAQV